MAQPEEGFAPPGHQRTRFQPSLVAVLAAEIDDVRPGHHADETRFAAPSPVRRRIGQRTSLPARGIGAFFSLLANGPKHGSEHEKEWSHLHEG